MFIGGVSKSDRFIFWLYRLISRIQGWFTALLVGFLLGRIINEVSVPYTNWLDVLKGLFFITDRPANFLTWLSIALLIAIPLGSRGLNKSYRKRQYEKIFASLVQRHKSPSIARFNAIGWDDALSLQTCPVLSRGWWASEIRLNHSTTRFSLPKEYGRHYQEYFKRYYQEKRFFDDGTKIMLMRNPVAFSDSPTLVLETKEALFSQIQFYRDNVAVLTSKRDEHIRKVVDELSVLFPHPLCMHVVVVTKDDKVLITKRSPKVIYFPGTWSCSIEEQLSPQDLQRDPNRTVLKWFERSLWEELGLDSETYNKDNLRVLSVFLESDILSISVCAHAVLDIESAELNQILKCLPRTDYEFTEWEFLTHEELLNELFNATRPYHPTSRYRILLALIRRYGEPKVAERLFK
jgi:isopentenyldiphosphate isomerase